MGYQGKKSLWKRHNKYNDMSNYKVGVKVKKVTNFIRNNVKVVVAFILGGIILGTCGAYASSVISASDVSYSNASSGIPSTNVQGAIDSLYTKAKDAEAKCPDGYKCTKMMCKRATTLHKEVCANSDTRGYCQADGYSNGSQIEYGSLGTKGILASGDAFDCDVNGDGTYDPATERFYYVSDAINRINDTEVTDNNTAVLIYYSNVSAGVPSNKTYAYTSATTYINGPVTAREQLPTTSQWKTRLTNTERLITEIIKFSYEGYAARLLSAREVSAGCGFTVGNYNDGELSTKCKYLMENTMYSNASNKIAGEWLETPVRMYDYFAWSIAGFTRSVPFGGTIYHADSVGVRPAIEVPKSDISY